MRWGQRRCAKIPQSRVDRRTRTGRVVPENHLPPDSVGNRRSEMIGGVTTHASAQVQPRRATEQDVAALVHLRSLMFSSMGSDVGGEDAAWRVAAADWLREQLTRPQQFAGFVMEHPADGVVCAALGSCDARAPSPNDVSGSHGHVFNICTEPAHRRSGYAQACLGALLAWFQTDTGVRVVHLSATPRGRQHVPGSGLPGTGVSLDAAATGSAH
jgi:ribosomal protein S18 acetylase RimI-like enzyme